jgi:hypothetical protein
MVRYGVVWYGWFGLVWFGLVSLVWSGKHAFSEKARFAPKHAVL